MKRRRRYKLESLFFINEDGTIFSFFIEGKTQEEIKEPQIQKAEGNVQ